MRNKKINVRGFTLVEVLVATAIFLIFAAGIYETMGMVFRIVYQSRIKILETALLSEQIEIVRNLPYESVGILNGIPSGVLSHSQTLVRDGVAFHVITSVRNIDDTFDGTLGGSPIDTSAADYKLVEISAICDSCVQQVPVKLSTLVAPKNLEGASQNGALFINVFDSNGLPVVGANVHIVNSSQNPAITVDDVTDNDGMLRIVDAPTGTLGYQISVSKSGYSSDYTVTASVGNPNPLKPPSTVVSQSITEISFSIDRLASMNISSVDNDCSAISGPTANINGEKVLGLNPNVYKFSQSFSLGSGSYNLNNLEWDTYHLGLSGTTYDIAGTVPMFPYRLNPGSQQNVYVILQAHSANSLLVKVKDAGTGLPLSDATVQLVGTGYDRTLQTSLGYTRQTDWSGGSGQSTFSDDSQYFNDNGNIANNSPAGDLKLKKVGNIYVSSGNLESSTFDFGEGGVTFRNIIWEPLSQAAQTGNNSILFQLAGTNSSTPASWEFLGPDGTSSTYYTATNTLIHSGLSGNRYLRYKVFLSTEDNRYTPQLSEVAFTYTNDCTPPGQTFFNGLSAGNYTLQVSRAGYTTNSGPIDISGNNETEVNMSPL